MQELFGVSSPDGGFLGDANIPGTNDLSDLFTPNELIPVPEPSSIVMTALGLAAVVAYGRRRLARKAH
jgi:hypothetical protein